MRAEQAGYVRRARRGFFASHWKPAILGLAVFVAAFYAFDRRPPMQVGEPKLSATTVSPGATIEIDWEQHWSRLCPGEIIRSVEGKRGDLHIMRTLEVEVPSHVGERRQVGHLYVPNSVSAGVARLNSTIRFRCNFMQELWPIVVKIPAIEINVLDVSPRPLGVQ